MWTRRRRPSVGDRRAVPLNGSGLVLAHRKALRNRDSVWALEEFDGKLWGLQGISEDPGSAARYVLENSPLRGRRAKRKAGHNG